MALCRCQLMVLEGGGDIGVGVWLCICEFKSINYPPILWEVLSTKQSCTVPCSTFFASSFPSKTQALTFSTRITQITLN